MHVCREQEKMRSLSVEWIVTLVVCHWDGLGAASRLQEWSRQTVSCKAPDEIFLVTNSSVT